MVRGKKTQVGITVKVPKFTEKEREKLRKAVRGVNLIMDAHDLTTVTLPDGVRIHYKRAQR